MTTRGMLPILLPGTVVLIRPGNRIHIGCDPERGIIVELDSLVPAGRVASLLATLTEPRLRGEIRTELAACGLSAAELDQILAGLVAAGRARTPHATNRPGNLDHTDNSDRDACLERVRVHGSGVLATLISASLSDAGFIVTRTAQRSGRRHSGRPTDLVILTDYLVHDPMVVGTLIREATPHLQVQMRDGIGVFGPLVLPGLTTCLHCIDLHRTDLDPSWPTLATQLVRVRGHGSAAAVRATAALVHEHVEHLATAVRNTAVRTATHSTPPQLIGRTLELHANPTRITTKEWERHPLCPCRDLSVTR
ncbi:MAG: hypothetical protein QM673_15300 [Gordonia sp. (in: high G+C Gram-positive bacteria)]